MGNFFGGISDNYLLLLFLENAKGMLNIVSITLVQDFRLKLQLLAISYRISTYCALMPFFFVKFYNIT